MIFLIYYLINDDNLYNNFNELINNLVNRNNTKNVLNNINILIFSVYNTKTDKNSKLKYFFV